MMAGEGQDRSCSYTEVLLHLNGFCGHRVTARVAYERDQVFRIEGVLEHVPIEGTWANYRIGDLEIDLGVFQQQKMHWISGDDGCVRFWAEEDRSGMRVDVWLAER